MKSIFTTLACLLCVLGLNAQSKPVYLRLTHNIGTESLSMVKGSYTAPNGVKYKLKRLQYYISGITIVHDGAQVTSCDNVYLLAEPGNTDYFLGEYDLDKVEKIVFNIGVDSVTNHSDPTAFPAEHALSPKNPSMHWGWAAGYRFAAIEGNSDGGNGLYADVCEFHTIGDELLTSVEVLTEGITENNSTIIPLTADYNVLFTGIDLYGGVIQHGNLSPNNILMANFKNVYTGYKAVSTSEYKDKNFTSIAVSPYQELNIQYNSVYNNMNFGLYNAFGSLVFHKENIASKGAITGNSGLAAGLYYYNFTKGNNIVASGKIVIVK